jgi:hypothetical protein
MNNPGTQSALGERHRMKTNKLKQTNKTPKIIINK